MTVRKYIYTVFVLVIAFCDLKAVTAVLSGDWDQTATWGGNPIPNTSDNVIIGAGIDVTLVSSYTTSGTIVVEGNVDLNGNDLECGSISGSGNIDNSLAFQLCTVTVGGNNSDATFSGIIKNSSGTVSLAKIGAGSFTLTAINTFTGNTTITNGSLILAGSFGNVDGDIVNNGTLYFSQTDIAAGVLVDVNISGTGNVVSTAGTVVLGGNNSYTGSTSVLSGKLGVAHANSLGSTASGTEVHGSASLLLWGMSLTFAAEPLVLHDLSTFRTAYNLVDENVSWTGPITLAGNSVTIGAYDANDVLDITSIISGAYNITKSGDGTVVFSSANTYAGVTTVNDGVLKLANANALGTVDGGTVIASGASLDLNGQTYSNTESISLEGTGESGQGALFSSSAQNSSFAGAISLTGATSIVADNTISLTGTISNNQDFTKSGNDTLFLANTCNVQTLTITDGMLAAGNSSVFISGDFTATGIFIPQTSTVSFIGSSIQSISAGNFNNLTIANTNGDVYLTGDITASGTVSLADGIFYTQANQIDIGISGAVDESTPTVLSPSSYIVGTVTASREIGSTSGVVDFGGIGVSIDEANTVNNLTQVTRITGSGYTVSGNASIGRYYSIHPTTDVGLNADFVFSYFDHELSGQNEADLEIYKSDDGGGTWANTIPVRNESLNQLALSGVTSFSDWTASDGTPAVLPIVLAGFSAVAHNGFVDLTWATSSEHNSEAFMIEKSRNALDWHVLAKVSAAGNSSEINEYQLIDDQANEGLWYYRLKQVDFDGRFAYSEIRDVYCIRNQQIICYPNPVSNSLYISDVAVDGYIAELRATDGSLVSQEMVTPEKPMNVSAFSNGIYYLTVYADGQIVLQQTIRIE